MPDLARLTNVPLVGVGEVPSSEFGIVARGDLWLRVGGVDILGEAGGGERVSDDVEPVVLVGRLGEHLLAHLGSGLTVCDDWLGDLDGRTAHEVLLQILEADLDVQLAASGDDVLSALLGHADDERVALGEALESLDELGQILRILGLDGDAHDGAHRVLHGAVVRPRSW